jgi:DedD protein
MQDMSNTEQLNSEDDLKRQARRRLIGAVALVTAVVVILPMVLDNEPKPNGHDIELRIPDKDRAGEFTSQMVLPESAPAASEVAASAPAVSAAAPAMPVVPVAPHVEKKQPAPEKHEPVKAQPQKNAHEQQAHKAPPKQEPKHADKAQAVPKDGFVVQVGAFANADTAREWQKKLAAQGLHAYTEKAGNAIRVRVGAYATRAAAEKVQHKLQAQGTQPVVINLN